MAGQGFDPNFIFGWPTARIGVMEGEAAVQAIFGPELTALKEAGKPMPPDLDERIRQTRADYERWLDAKYAAARGHCDALKIRWPPGAFWHLPSRLRAHTNIRIMCRSKRWADNSARCSCDCSSSPMASRKR